MKYFNEYEHTYENIGCTKIFSLRFNFKVEKIAILYQPGDAKIRFIFFFKLTEYQNQQLARQSYNSPETNKRIKFNKNSTNEIFF